MNTQNPPNNDEKSSEDSNQEHNTGENLGDITEEEDFSNDTEERSTKVYSPFSEGVDATGVEKIILTDEIPKVETSPVSADDISGVKKNLPLKNLFKAAIQNEKSLKESEKKAAEDGSSNAYIKVSFFIMLLCL